MEKAELPGSDSAKIPDSDPKRWYYLAILAITYLVASIDRQIIVIAAEPIKHEFGLSDTQIGFLAGTSFAIAFALASIPFGLAIDRYNRKNLLAGAVAFWSICTAMGGAANNYWQLVLSRMAVGAAESPSNTTGYSLITDFFRWEERSRAMGIYSIGSGLGALVGLGVGGYITFAYGWRAAFFLAGMPGLLVALLLIFTVREPKRRKSNGMIDDSVKAPPMMETFRFMWSQRALVFLLSAFWLGSMTMSGLSIWLPSFFVRIHEVSLKEIGIALGLIYGIAGVFGGILGGMAADFVGKRKVVNIPKLVAGLMGVMTAVYVALLYVPNTTVAFVLFALGLALFFSYQPAIYSLTQVLVHARMRGVSSSVLAVGGNLIGFGLGPQIVGMLSDVYAPWAGLHAIQYAIATMLTLNVLSFLLFFISTRSLECDLKRVA